MTFRKPPFPAFAAISVILIALLSVPFLMAQPKPEEVFRNSRQAVVLLKSNRGMGTGFFIQDSILVTALHVVEGIDWLMAYSGEDSFQVTGWLAADDDADIALLAASEKAPRILHLRPEAPEVGSRVYTLGSSMGVAGSFSDGIVGNLVPDEVGITWVQYTAPSSPGNSGGPLLDEFGEVVGVVCRASWLRAQNMNYAAPVSVIRELLEYITGGPMPFSELTQPEVALNPEPDISQVRFETRRFGRFEVDVPEGWEWVDGKGKGGSVFILYSPAEGPEDIYRENISLVEGTGKFVSKKLGLLTYISLIRKNLPGFELISMDDQADPPYISYSGLIQDVIPVTGVSYLYNELPNNYMLEFGWETTESLARMRPVFRRVMASLRAVR